MKLSVMLFPYEPMLINGEISAKDLIKTLKATGIDAVETMFGLQNRAPEIHGQLADAIAEANLPYACYDIGVNLIAEGDLLEERLETARTQIAYAAEKLHCGTVLLYNSRKGDALSNDGARKIYARNLCQLTKFARRFDVKVTIENFDPTPELACSAKDCLDILNMAGPDTGLTFDTGNFFAVGQTPVAVFPMLRHRIAHCHVKDLEQTDSTRNMSIAGRGVAQIPQCISLLKSIAYRGYISLELNRRPLEDTVTSLECLRREIDA